MNLPPNPDTKRGTGPVAAVRSSALRRSGRIGALALTMLGGLLAVGIIPRAQRAAELRAAVGDPQSRLVPVNVVVPRPAPAATDLDLPGNVQAFEETPIYARVDGYLRQRYVDIGDRVERGQVLAEIDTPELD